MTRSNNITTLIEQRLAENKSSLKTYATYENACARADELNANFMAYNDSKIDIDYIVVFLPLTQRWTPVFNITAWTLRSQQGTYIGFFSQQGFFSL